MPVAVVTKGHKERDLGGKIVGILCLIRYGIKD